MSGVGRRLGSVAVLVAVVALPACAQAARKAQPYRSYGRPQAAPRPPYLGQRRYDGDPDPNVQFDLMRQWNWRKGG